VHVVDLAEFALRVAPFRINSLTVSRRRNCDHGLSPSTNGANIMATPPTISEGASGPVVKWLQYRLVRRNLSANQVDGLFGPITKTNVEEFQSGSGLVVDGIVGPLTWGALGGDGPEPPTLNQGSSGSTVSALQTALNEGRGDFAPATNPVLTVDGDFGPHTKAAVEGTQQQGGIPVDGIVGLQTWALSVHAAGQVLADLCGVPDPNS
jgi:peptidoglycan hydrolase-like protein with peptidoglycan-binding domain